MLVRSWNLFHGNTVPPQRAGFLARDDPARDRRRTGRALRAGGACLGARPFHLRQRRGSAPNRPGPDHRGARAPPDAPESGAAAVGVLGSGKRDSRRLRAARPVVDRADPEPPPLQGGAGSHARARRSSPPSLGEGAADRTSRSAGGPAGRTFAITNLHCTSYAADERLAEAELLRAAWFARLRGAAGRRGRARRRLQRDGRPVGGPPRSGGRGVGLLRARPRYRSHPRSRSTGHAGALLARRAARCTTAACFRIMPRWSSRSHDVARAASPVSGARPARLPERRHIRPARADDARRDG